MTTQFTRFSLHLHRPVYAAIGAALFAFGTEASSQAFKSKDFLEMPEMQQKGYIDGAVSTLYQMAAQESIQTGQCVHDWYYGDKTSERNWLILDTMQKNPDYRPSVIIAALAESVCGRFVRRENNRQG